MWWSSTHVHVTTGQKQNTDTDNLIGTGNPIVPDYVIFFKKNYVENSYTWAISEGGEPPPSYYPVPPTP